MKVKYSQVFIRCGSNVTEKAAFPSALILSVFRKKSPILSVMLEKKSVK